MFCRPRALHAFSRRFRPTAFSKKTSVIEYSKEQLLLLADQIELLAETEGLTAHKNSIAVRRKEGKTMKIPEKLLKLKAYDPTEDIYKVKLDANESPLKMPPKKSPRKSPIAGRKLFRLTVIPTRKQRKSAKLAAGIFGVFRLRKYCCRKRFDELISVILGAFTERARTADAVKTRFFPCTRSYAGLCELELN